MLCLGILKKCESNINNYHYFIVNHRYNFLINNQTQTQQYKIINLLKLS